jgi:hypothetical protein
MNQTIHVQQPQTKYTLQIPTRCINKQSLFSLLHYSSTCFRCLLHPSSQVHKTVVTTTGTSHVSRWHSGLNPLKSVHWSGSYLLWRGQICYSHLYKSCISVTKWIKSVKKCPLIGQLPTSTWPNLSPRYMTCTSGCNYSFMYSWWWMQKASETCRGIMQ